MFLQVGNRSGIWWSGPYGLRLLIFLQPLGRALKNQNAAPTTPPCFSRWLRSSSLLFKSSYPQLLRKRNCHVKQKRQWTVCLPVDIPTGWEPRAKQQPTGLIAYGAARRRPVQVLLSAVTAKGKLLCKTKKTVDSLPPGRHSYRLGTAG